MYPYGNLQEQPNFVRNKDGFSGPTHKYKSRGGCCISRISQSRSDFEPLFYSHRFKCKNWLNSWRTLELLWFSAFSFSPVFWVNTKPVMLKLTFCSLPCCFCFHRQQLETRRKSSNSKNLEIIRGQSEWKSPSLTLLVLFQCPKWFQHRAGESLPLQLLASQVGSTKSELVPSSSTAFAARAALQQTETARLISPWLDLIFPIRVRRNANDSWKFSALLFKVVWETKGRSKFVCLGGRTWAVFGVVDDWL